MNSYLLKTILSALCVLSVSACTSQLHLPRAMLLPTPSIEEEVLFVVDWNLGKRLAYRFVLFKPESQALSVSEADLSHLGWDVGFGNSNSRFGVLHGSEFIHFNPETQEVIFVLSALPGGIAGWKPDDVLPEPPFEFAIYKTDITFIQPQQLYQSITEGKRVSHSVLNPSRNSLLLAIRSFGTGIQSEIWEFDIPTGEMNLIAQIIPTHAPATQELIEASDLSISPDGKKLFQLLLYGEPGRANNQTLYLATIGLENLFSELLEVGKGDGIYYGSKGFSTTTETMAFYADELWVKNMKNQFDPLVIPTDGIKNWGLYISPDGTKILVGLQSGWEYYDLFTQTYHHTPLDRPFLWDPSSRYIFGERGDEYIVYDTQTMTEIKIPVQASRQEYEIQSAQWR